MLRNTRARHSGRSGYTKGHEVSDLELDGYEIKPEQTKRAMREENPETGTQHPVPRKIGRFFAVWKEG